MCFQNTFIVPYIGHEVILGTPFLKLFFPFTASSKGVLTEKDGKEILFESAKK